MTDCIGYYNNPLRNYSDTFSIKFLSQKGTYIFTPTALFHIIFVHMFA